MIQSTHPDYPKTLPSVTSTQLFVYRIIARIDREITILREGYNGSVSALARHRLKRVMGIASAEFEKWMVSLLGKLGMRTKHSLAYRLYSLHEMHHMAYRAYKPNRYRGKATIIRASIQPVGIDVDPTLGWEPLIEGGLELYEVPGNQARMIVEPRVEHLSDQLRECIEMAQTGTVKASGMSQAVNMPVPPGT
jgi:thioesterase domain-containing protein